MVSGSCVDWAREWRRGWDWFWWWGWEADELQQAGLSAVIDTSTLWSQQAGIHDNSILSGIFLSSLPPLPFLGIKPYRRQILEEWSGLGKPFKGVSEALNTNPMNGSNTD